MATSSVMASSLMSLKPAPFTVKKPSLPSLSRRPSFKVEASRSRKSKTDQPYGINGGMDLRGGLDASGRKGKGKGVYQFVDKYGANVDGYSGTTGLLIWAVTLAGLLAGGALLVYNTSALVQ
uniref:Photosystem II 10 kDa polypeptide, chloroplastic n=1 Tax=Populus tomentosa TaxID=118781 RepID=A0A3Q9EEX9_POPTO|nr:polypeptide precursor of photosystem II [Populus tomentosa]